MDPNYKRYQLITPTGAIFASDYWGNNQDDVFEQASYCVGNNWELRRAYIKKLNLEGWKAIEYCSAELKDSWNKVEND